MKIIIVLLALGILALPFLFRQAEPHHAWKTGDPEIVIVTPHNEAIRQEFATAFSAWHQQRFGTVIRIDWRVIGGTTEIMRYLVSEYGRSANCFFRQHGTPWPTDGADVILAPTCPVERPAQRLWKEFRTRDSPQAITCQIDLFFGGGTYDHDKAQKRGLTVPAWGTNAPPEGLFTDAKGRTLIPRVMGGERWYGRAFYGTVLSGFGICYNRDRLVDLGITTPPTTWEALADPRYVGQLGLADPTKSGSVAKAFEMLIHAQCAKAVAAAGFTRDQIRIYEAAITAAGLPAGDCPRSVPPGYQQAIETGWLKGINLLRRMGANAIYFNDSASKIPVDVSMGIAAAGIAIDFMGRFQSEMSTPPGRQPVMTYVNPIAGTSMNADPISLLRGAPHREIAVRFIEFTLSEEGQRLWNYRPGTPGGPQRFALRRLPIRRTFYPSEDPEFQAVFESRRSHLSDPLWQPDVDAYRLAEEFFYEPRWTATHFGLQRDLVRCMCMDSGDELKRAWRSILAHGGPEKNPHAMAFLEALPDTPYPLTWRHAITDYTRIPRMDILRLWTAFFRNHYQQAEAAADLHGAESRRSSSDSGTPVSEKR